MVRHELLCQSRAVSVRQLRDRPGAGPKIVNTDFSVFKRTPLGSARSLELRVETFNIFNHAQFSNPNTSFGNSQFGRITSTRLPSREIQLGARFLF